MKTSILTFFILAMALASNAQTPKSSATDTSGKRHSRAEKHHKHKHWSIFNFHRHHGHKNGRHHSGRK